MLALDNELRENSTILTGLRDSNIPDGKIALLVLEAVTTRSKSLAPTKNILRRVNGLLQFYLDTRNETSASLTGESSLVLIHNYLEPLAERGRTVPAAGKHALIAWAEALGIDWPLTNPLVLSAAVVESNDEPKQAPAMELGTVKATERIALDTEVCVYKRAFDAGILLMTFASLRFADVQRIRSFDVNTDSVHGTLLSSKTKKPHGLNWPWACPIVGLAGSTQCVQPIIELRSAYRRVDGQDMCYTFPRLDRKWKLAAQGPAPYSTARRKLALLCNSIGDPNGEAYTLRSPKNFSFRIQPNELRPARISRYWPLALNISHARTLWPLRLRE